MSIDSARERPPNELDPGDRTALLLSSEGLSI